MQRVLSVKDLNHFMFVLSERHKNFCQLCCEVVMINVVFPPTLLQAKCAQYWPLGSDLGYEDSMLFEDVGLIVTLIGEQDSTNFVQRWFTVEELAVGI